VYLKITYFIYMPTASTGIGHLWCFWEGHVMILVPGQ